MKFKKCDKCKKEMLAFTNIHTGNIYGQTKSYEVCDRCIDKVRLYIEGYGENL